MEHLPDLIGNEVATGKITLLAGPKGELDAMLRLASALALRGPVHVLDAGNCFNSLKVARLVRRQTAHPGPVLDRIQAARAFTCYQVVTLFRQAPAVSAPHLVLDLLATFYEGGTRPEEARRLLRVVIGHLMRLRQNAPVVVSLRSRPDPPGLVKMLREAADDVLVRQKEPKLSQASLF